MIYAKLTKRWAAHQHTQPKMSAVIQMPPAIDASIRACCTEAVQQAVAVLAAKYKFDAEEAERELKLDELKLERKRGPKNGAQRGKFWNFIQFNCRIVQKGTVWADRGLGRRLGQGVNDS